MSYRDVVINALATVLSNKDGQVAALSLSKGGWEGWLQCELWQELSMTYRLSAEREYPYPAPYSAQRCDIVINEHSWIELKAFGIFRDDSGSINKFLASISEDCLKINHIPVHSEGLCIVVVPKVLEDSVGPRLGTWVKIELATANIYYQYVNR